MNSRLVHGPGAAAQSAVLAPLIGNIAHLQHSSTVCSASLLWYAPGIFQRTS